ncbi:FAD-dependent oxidoreductase [Rhodococcus sp. WB9]|nr:FAD-dependent oxidoreductase [Rhodococcus sp. WB9]
MGFPGSIEYLSGDEARQRRTAVGPGVQVAAHTSIVRHINRESLLQGLLEKVTEMGVTALQHTAVETVTPAGAKWSIQTPDHSLDNDHAVIALGAATNALLNPLGIQLPIIGVLSPYRFATGHARQPAVHRPGSRSPRPLHRRRSRHGGCHLTLKPATTEGIAELITSIRESVLPFQWAGRI